MNGSATGEILFKVKIKFVGSEGEVLHSLGTKDHPLIKVLSHQDSTHSLGVRDRSHIRQDLAERTQVSFLDL